MKIKSYLALLTFLVLSAPLLSAKAVGYNDQGSNTDVMMNRRIILDDESTSREILIEAQKSTKMFQLKVECEIFDGELQIEIYDSENQKLGNFSIGKQIESEKVKESVGGRISKSIKDPIPGNWKVKISPKNASGNISISSSYKQ